MTTSDFMTVDEVAALLRRSRQSICRDLESGHLPGVRLGKVWRISATQLENLFARGQAGSTPSPSGAGRESASC
jgi:excisionase family DNA binding protein